MGLYATLGVLAGYILLSLIFLPFQYSYIKQLKEMEKKCREQGLSQDEMYDKMSFEYQELHINAQGNFLLIGENLMPSLFIG
ncbi:DUF3949 domain-containing protein [Metabacillus sp. RGM 3146]|uniref:DUF3949 domain-containing protein n=1 Tax=Metabacillus sp. RGM 3146 TaxID=3401092 RepID=UPI003B9D1AC1